MNNIDIITELIDNLSSTNTKYALQMLLIGTDKYSNNFISFMVDSLGIPEIIRVAKNATGGVAKELYDYAKKNINSVFADYIDECYDTWKSPDLKYVMKMIENGADPNTISKSESTALSLYLYHNVDCEITPNLAKLISLTNRTGLDKYVASDYTNLHMAVAYENVPLIKELLKTGKYDVDLENILVYALIDDECNELLKKFCCGWETFKCLVDAGANLNAVNDGEYTCDFEGASLLDLVERNWNSQLESYQKVRTYLIEHNIKNTLNTYEEDYDY
jgi:hypothetical protein